MEFVAVTLPVVVKVASILIPLPPPAPPVQFENTTGETPVKAAPRFTPWLAPVLPAEVVKVTVPEVPGVQLPPTETPCDPVTVPWLVPLTLIAPEVLVIEFAALERLIPKEAVLLAPLVPISVIAPVLVLSVPPVSEIP